MLKKLPAVTILITIALIGAVLACGSPTQLVTMNFHKDQVDNLISESEFKADSWAFLYSSVDLLDDFMRLHGSFGYNEKPEVNGYLDVRLSVQENSLQADVVASDFGDFHPSQEDQLALASEILQVLKDEVEEGKQAVQYVSVEMLQDNIKIQLRFLP